MKDKGGKISGGWWLALCSLLMLGFLLVPLLAIVARSLIGGTLGQYLNDPDVSAALSLSLSTTAITLLLSVVCGTPLAYLLARHNFRGHTALDTLLDLPMVLPPAVAGVALLVTFGRRGFIGGWLEDSFGISIGFTTAAVVLAQTFVAAPFYIKAAKAGFESVDPTMEIVAATLGSRSLPTFWRITVPLALPALLSGVVMTWARALGEFGATIMFAGSFAGRTRTLPLAIYAALEGDGGLDEALTLSVILVVVSFAVLITVKLLARRQSVSSVPSVVATRDDADGIEYHPDEHDFIPRNTATHNTPERNALDADFTLDIQGFRLVSRVKLDSGRVLVLFGPSGSGKSLTLKAIAGVVQPGQGHIAVNGRTVADMARNISISPQSRNVGYVPQNYALFPHMSVADNIAFGIRDLSAGERQARVTHLIAAMRLSGLAGRKPHELSGGQQQRVALARALATQPAILLLDEPFAAVDATIRQRLRGQVRDLSRSLGIPVIIVTHDLDEAYMLADRIAVFENGQVVQSDTPDAIIARPATPTVARLFGTRNILSGVIAPGAVQIGTLRLPYAMSAPVGTPVTVCIRPERIEVLPATATSLYQGRLISEMAHIDHIQASLEVAGVTLVVDVPRQLYVALGLADLRLWPLAIPADALHVIPTDAPPTPFVLSPFGPVATTERAS